MEATFGASVVDGHVLADVFGQELVAGGDEDVVTISTGVEEIGVIFAGAVRDQVEMTRLVLVYVALAGEREGAAEERLRPARILRQQPVVAVEEHAITVFADASACIVLAARRVESR